MANPCIELMLDDTALRLPLGASAQDIQLLLAARRFDQDDDPDTHKTYFELPDNGLEIIVSNGALSTVFLYLARSGDHRGVFRGGTNFLSREFFEAPSAHQFEQILARQGFVRSSRHFPNAVDMLTADVRLRYETRTDQQIICFDDGAGVRGS